MNDKIKKFANLNFEDFKKLAQEEGLSSVEKIGFPDSYRAGYEKIILEDILSKNPILLEKGQKVVDIGAGCSELIFEFIDFCESMEHTLILIDSQEMLDLIPDKPFITKVAGYYPDDLKDFIQEYEEKINCIITYSVFHYIFTEGNIFSFLDQSIKLLAENGSFFIGDIPNQTKRKRFFSTEQGIKFHQNYTGDKNSFPEKLSFELEEGKIDDGVIFSILGRYRRFGMETYVLPQPDDLPMSNRREDILIIKK